MTTRTIAVPSYIETEEGEWLDIDDATVEQLRSAIRFEEKSRLNLWTRRARGIRFELRKRTKRNDQARDIFATLMA